MASQERFDKFIAELEALCRSHRVTLDVSGYDPLVVSDFDDYFGPICGCLENDLSDQPL